MASEFIGVIIGALTGRVEAVINPDDDSELDNPRFLLLTESGEGKEPMRMVKIPREDYMGALSMADIARLVASFK